LERGREVERMIRARATDSKDTTTIIITASSLAKKARSSTMGTNKTCSYRRSGENKYSHSMPDSAGRAYISQLICHEHRQ